ncbi:tryptophan synthase subunit alpha [Helicobacter equorum]|uniref:tryptophan synthase subunit alpha n=1 Tax=Helicobacter equorum TaxID=361872 RepID=UPI000CF155D5|nr:tryptophan synthase subunit alpha [Helicobacter equorum]
MNDIFTHKAFIPFITCGYPNLDISEEIIYTLAENGADLIELGIPFSDPVAEGAVIQKASEEALKNGVSTDAIFDMVARVRRKCNVPLAFMTYANVVFSYGSTKFMQKANALDIQALLLPDVPFEEKQEFEEVCDAFSINLISFVAPTSAKRLIQIIQEAKGFVYCVSSYGVTGVRENINNDVKAMVDSIKSIRDIPVAVGFGISTPEQAKTISRYADGVVIGSAIVKLCAQHGKDAPKHIGAYAKSIKQAMQEI